MVEDGVVEWLTALGYVASGLVALLMIKKRDFFTDQRVKKFFTVGCVAVGLAFLVVAGEEISWGQRLVGFETPEMIAAQNRQNEINLHNSELIWPYVYTAYAAVGLYGMLMWLGRWLVKGLIKFNQQWQIWLKIIVPGPHLILNFGLIVLYVWLRGHHGPWKYQLWEEYAELLLVIGIIVHLLEVYVTFPKLLQRHSKSKGKSNR